jgi:hypothetical protein
MSKQSGVKRLFRAVAGFGAVGVVLGGSCSAAEMQAVVAGLEAVARTLQAVENDETDEISFSDWLVSELED